MNDIQEIYARLLSRGYQSTLFAALSGQQKQGREMLAQCPYCSKERHFSYSLDKPLWRCWSCGQAGDWLKYLEQIRGLTFIESLQFLAEAAGIEMDGQEQTKERHQAYNRRADILEAAQEYFIEALHSPAGEPVLSYLRQRGYTDQDIQRMELGAYPDRAILSQVLQTKGYTAQEIKDSGLLTKGFGETHTLAFLFRDPSGRAIGLVTGATDREHLPDGVTKYKFSYGMSRSDGFIGFTASRRASQIVLVEGVLDALYINNRMESEGASPGGKKRSLQLAGVGGVDLSAAQIQAMEAAGVEELLLNLDSDTAGQQATERLIRVLRQSKLRPYVVTLPDGYKDPDELVRSQGVEPYLQALERAERWPAWLARHIAASQDLETDRGQDRVLRAAGEVYSGIEDKIERRVFHEALMLATGLNEYEMEERLQEQEVKASSRRSEEALRSLLRKVESRIGEGDLLGAEVEITDGLQSLRSSRGATTPEPYLLTDLTTDLLTTSEGLQTGYRNLDKLCRIPQGAITIIAGRPGHGKTTMQLNLLLLLLEKYPDQKFCFFSFEEARKYLSLKLIMMMAGVTLHKEDNQYAYLNYFQRRMLRQERSEEIEQAIQKFEELTTSGRLLFSDQRLTAEDLAATIGYLSQREEIGAVFVDYIQKIPLQKPQSQRYLDIKRASELLLERAVASDVPILLGAQLGRDKTAKTKVKLDNLRESGDIEQDASLVLGVYNESVDKVEDGETVDKSEEVEIEAHVLKNRSGIAGRKAILSFERPVLRIKDKFRNGVWD